MTATLLVNYAIEGRQRRFIKQAFNQYLHPTVIDQLLTHPERLSLGGERREVGYVQVVGRNEPVRIYEPLSQAVSGVLDQAAFARAMELYRAGDFAQAAEAFATLAGADPVAACYRNRCERLAADAPADWDGIWHLHSK